MAEFQPAFRNTLRYEDSVPSGAVTIEPDDPRFPGVKQKARFGINSAAHPNMPLSFWTDPAEQAVKLAEGVYLSDYWNPLALGAVINQDVANKLFDMAVSMGRKEAIILAQRACAALRKQIAVDGLMGQHTLDAINSSAPADLLNELRILSVATYQHIEQIHPADVRWDAGWMSRARA